jgi:hypothetical protein
MTRIPNPRNSGHPTLFNQFQEILGVPNFLADMVGMQHNYGQWLAADDTMPNR